MPSTPPALDDGLADALRDALADGGPVVVITGAGISAESGIPTFRGPEGYWTVGSEVYTPAQLATRSSFDANPARVWAWYLYRLGVCEAAAPNDAHRALARLDAAIGDRVRLLTQNVDGLHLRAGSPLERTWQIHGNIGFERCVAACGGPPWPIDGDVRRVERGEVLDDDALAARVCPRCGGPSRPHVLWFDETYDEVHFRFESSIEVATRAAVLITIGTSGATNLPMHVGAIAARRGALLIDVNPGDNPFARLARNAGGHWIAGSSGAVVPALVDAVIAGVSRSSG